MRDFNVEPGSLKAVHVLLDTQLWIDVGLMFLGGAEDATPTCQTRPQARPTRIDCVIANNLAIPWISGFQVIKDEMIPAHSVLQITLDRKADKEERTYAKNLPSLKTLFDMKVEGVTKGMQGKEKGLPRKRS